jgi:hypothetical protein
MIPQNHPLDSLKTLFYNLVLSSARNIGSSLRSERSGRPDLGCRSGVFFESAPVAAPRADTGYRHSSDRTDILPVDHDLLFFDPYTGQM